jgi:predicted nucleic acid-binding protein
MLFVVDTSSLIVLQKLGWLDKLSHPDDEFICPPKVIQELKNNKKLLGWLKQKAISETKVEKPIKISDISATDAEVVSLALEQSGSVLSEDLLLSKKAQRLAIPVYNLSRLIVLYYQLNRITQDDCLIRLKTLVDKSILPKTIYRQLVESIKS